MNNEMAYLLGMITGNGVIQRGVTTTTISIDVPHKNWKQNFREMWEYMLKPVSRIFDRYWSLCWGLL